jgi:DNA (cytosine-5)-methyltransferase 1
MPEDIRIIDLFAGAGGLTSGFHVSSARYRTVAAVEMDVAAAASFGATFGQDTIFSGSIQEWLSSRLLPTADVILGGPPCQGFSSLGKQASDDPRNRLWEEYAKAVSTIRPKYFVMENVAEFSKSPEARDLRRATNRGGLLEDYDFRVEVLNAADFGAAQRRRRAVILGFRKDVNFSGFPKPSHGASSDGAVLRPHVSVRDVISGVPAMPDSDQFFLDRRTDINGKLFPGVFTARELHWSRKYSQLSLDRFQVIPVGGSRKALEPYPDLMAPCWVRHKTGSGDVMGRLHWDRPSVTIRTEFFKPEKGRYLHPELDRAITHYEAALIQGFDENHRFVGSKTSIARQIGNAVPIALGSAIALKLVECL